MRHLKIAVLCLVLVVSTTAKADKTVRFYGPGEAPSAEDIASMLGTSRNTHSPASPTKGRLGKRKAYCEDNCDQKSSSNDSTSTAAPAQLATIEQNVSEYSNSRKTADYAVNNSNIEIAMQIEFALNSYNIEKTSLQALDKLGRGIAPVQALILIEGHTDALGSHDHNLSLSMKRAEAVKAYLVRLGVSPDRLITRGVAATKPLIKDDPYASRNRRVQFSLLN